MKRKNSRANSSAQGYASSFTRRTARTGVLLTLPALVGVAAFFLVPFCITLIKSVQFGFGEFVGIKNYSDIIKNPAFRLAAYNTLKFMGIAVPLIILISFAIALAIKRGFGGSRVFQSVLLFPLVLPVAAVVMVANIFLTNNGLLNALQTALGAQPTQWITSGAAFGVLVALYIWKNCGYNVVLLLCGLNLVPEELYQMAALDGAGAFKRLRYITLPLMWPSVFITFVMSVINAFKSFREAFLLGGMHPHSSIYMLQHFMNNNFENLNYARLSAAAVLVFAGIFIVVGIFYRLQSKEVC